MNLARIAAVIALATLATPLVVSANEEQKPDSSTEVNGSAMTRLETIRYGRSERSDPNWDRVEARR